MPMWIYASQDGVVRAWVHQQLRINGRSTRLYDSVLREVGGYSL